MTKTVVKKNFKSLFDETIGSHIVETCLAIKWLEICSQVFEVLWRNGFSLRRIPF